MLGLDLRPKRGEALAAELGAAVCFRNADVTSEADATAALAFAKQEFGHVHGLVNCGPALRPARRFSQERPARTGQFARTVAVNLIGTFNMIRLAAEVMSQGVPDADGEAGGDRQYRLDRRFRRANRPAAYAASKGGVPR